MHVEIKVAQNFVLNFLFNKLPRRRVNLFGEELELALRDKFADHWYPDKPFKGSAYRCLKITDTSDPVLNRAARESGNPIPDIVENLPADLAIWIDPGEVSYRIGEKGSVKILYSESDTSNFVPSNHAVSAGGGGANGGGNTSGGGSGNLCPPPPPPPAIMPPLSCNTDDLCSPCSSVDPSPNSTSNFLVDNLNAAIGSLSLNNGPSPNHHNNGLMPPPPPPPPPPINGSTTGNSAPNNGFAPFAPRQHQPVTYTAGTFAQTKFGSTKLKSNGKKTNRMSPTEFSNYIKQRAMQKASTSAGNGMMSGPPANMGPGNPFRNARPLQNGFYGNNSNQNNGFGGNAAVGSGRSGHASSNNDPFMYPLFPDRGHGGGGGSNNFSMLNIAPPSSGMFQNNSSGSSSAGSSSGSSTSSNNPWSYVDSDTDAFLQDILNVGFTSKGNNGPSGGGNGGSGAKGSLYSDFGNEFSSGSGGMGNSYGLGLGSGRHHSDSLGLGPNFGSLSNFGSSGSGSGPGMGSGGPSGSNFGGLSLFGGQLDGDLDTSSASGKLGSSTGGSGSSGSSQQQRVLVAN